MKHTKSTERPSEHGPLPGRSSPALRTDPAASARAEVVNVRDSDFDKYIGRAAPRAKDLRCHQTSLWANPYSDVYGARRAVAMAEYRQSLRERLSGPRRDEWLFQLRLLRGKRLGCWCKPKRCHGDVIVEAIIADQEGRLDEWIKGPKER